MTEDDQIPTIGEHLGVPLDDCQDQERLVVVRGDIDSVFEVKDDLAGLKKAAITRSRAPEARRFAAALITAMFEDAVAHGRARPDVDLDWLRAVVACLDRVHYRDKFFYDTWLAPRHPPGAPNGPVRRSRPLND